MSAGARARATSVQRSLMWMGLTALALFTVSDAAHHLAKLKPAGACEAVADATADTNSDGVDGAFWALSVLDKACEKTMLRLARDGSKAKVVRGMAVELLAMMRSAHAAKLIKRALRNEEVRYYAKRARVINASPE